MSLTDIKKNILSAVSRLFLYKPMENWLVKKTLGKYYGPMITKVIPSNTLYKIPSIRNVVRDKMNYHLDVSDIVDWHVYFGIKERAKEKLYSLAKEGDTVLDIGTNVGDVAMHLAQKVGTAGKVFGFEPDPMNFERVTRNLILNDFENLTVLNMGLGQNSGSFYVKSPDAHNAGMTRITDDETGSEVLISRLDDLDEINNLTTIDLIKIDVEGYEMSALIGGKNNIIRHKPILFIEVDNKNLEDQNSSAAELINFLEKLRYSIEHAETSERVSSKDDLKSCHFDIVCVHTST